MVANGRGAAFTGQDALARERLLVIPELDGADRDARIFLAAPVTHAELRRRLADRITTQQTVSWDPRSQAVVAVCEQKLGSLVLGEGAWTDAPAAAIVAVATWASSSRSPGA